MQTRENFINSVNLNAATNFPYLVLDVLDDKSNRTNPGFRVMHRHEDLQFVHVVSGGIEVRMLDASISGGAGDVIFINKNVVHCIERTGSCHYNSYIFPSYFLGFYAGSPVKDMTERVVSDSALRFVHFVSGTSQCGHMSALLVELSGLEGKKDEFYAYEVLVRLSALWLVMLKNMPAGQGAGQNAVSERMGRMLRYIENHYMDDLALEDLGKSAGVSKSECLRCFRTCLGTTPWKYLTEYRLSRAAQILVSTDESVGSIASRVGFNQHSHFGRCFREHTGYTPTEYREMQGSQQ